VMWDALALPGRPILQSDLGVEGNGTELLVRICERVGANRLAVFSVGERHIDLAAMKSPGIEIERLRFHPPVYPQLWGDFIYNLSALDLLMNCGPKAAGIIAGACGRGAAP